MLCTARHLNEDAPTIIRQWLRLLQLGAATLVPRCTEARQPQCGPLDNYRVRGTQS
jgi:hypothetical protein